MSFDREHDQHTSDEAREERVKRLILAAVTRCSTCHRQYQLENLAVIGHRDHLWMVTVVCARCRTQGFITAVIDGYDLDTADEEQAVSDLTAGEQQRFAVTEPVTVDDVLDLHQFLDNFDGDFASILDRDQ